jgi:predicted nucleotidyltransferase
MKEGASRPADPLPRVAEVLEGAQFAIVFGSYGTAGFGPESDLDVAVQFSKPLSFEERISLAGRLEEAAGRRVDIVDLREADPIIAMQVLRGGKPFLVADRRALTDFQMYTPTRYFDWKICRRPVEEAMKASATR